jgi:hypothetical protein
MEGTGTSVLLEMASPVFTPKLFQGSRSSCQITHFEVRRNLADYRVEKRAFFKMKRLIFDSLTRINPPIRSSLLRRVLCTKNAISKVSSGARASMMKSEGRCYENP